MEKKRRQKRDRKDLESLKLKIKFFSQKVDC